MRRREFIAGVGATAAAAPTRAQPATMPVIGFLYGGAAQLPANSSSAFLEGLKEQGFVPSSNVHIQFSGTGRYDHLPALAAAFAQQRVDVIVASGSVNSAQAAKAATSEIAIVFANGGDPIELGLVPSLNRPGGNITGITYLVGGLGGKRLELLLKFATGAESIGFLLNPTNQRSVVDAKELQAAVHSTGRSLAIIRASSAGQIEAGLKSAAQNRVGAVVVASDAFFVGRRSQIIGLAAGLGIPAIYASREYAVDGGLMSYGDDRRESYRDVGRYAGRILKGEKPAELPVLQPTRFQFVVNLKAAMALGLTVPPTLLAIADEVIE